MFFSRKLISEHERTETLIVNRHEEVKSKVRMIEDQCSAARSDFDSLENELDGLNQRYIKLRESALNLNTVSTKTTSIICHLYSYVVVYHQEESRL